MPSLRMRTSSALCCTTLPGSVEPRHASAHTRAHTGPEHPHQRLRAHRDEDSAPRPSRHTCWPVHFNHTVDRPLRSCWSSSSRRTSSIPTARRSTRPKAQGVEGPLQQRLRTASKGLCGHSDWLLWKRSQTLVEQDLSLDGRVQADGQARSAVAPAGAQHACAAHVRPARHARRARSRQARRRARAHSLLHRC